MKEGGREEGRKGRSVRTKDKWRNEKEERRMKEGGRKEGRRGGGGGKKEGMLHA